MTNIYTKKCLVCAKLFEKPSSCGLPEWGRRKYCSRVCTNAAPRSEWTRDLMRFAKVGKPSWNKGKFLSESHKASLRKKKSMSEEAKEKIRQQYRSGKRRVWNKIGDGITPINERIRKSPEYKQWRQEVFTRDGYTCKGCGQKGGDLHADHIKPFWEYVELRFELSNGRTLCVPCHRKTETYGKPRK